jgi:hypothetical protein
MRAVLLLIAATSAACGTTPPAGDGTACGIAAVAGPAMVLTEFSTAGATLSVPPATLPPRTVARFVAGPTAAAVVGRNGDSLEVGVEGGIPENARVGFGVLLTDPVGSVRGVLVYDGLPVLGAPRIGTVTVGPTRVPLLGLAIDPARFEDPRCPFFPDSILR